MNSFKFLGSLFNELSLENSFKSSKNRAGQRSKFIFEGYEIWCEFKKIKYLRLKISRDLRLSLGVPLSCNEKEIYAFLQKNKAWIAEKFALLQARQSEEKKFFFLGKKYELDLNESFEKTGFKSGILQAKNEADLEEFLHKNAKIIFSFYLKKWQGHFEKKITKIRIKKMQSRWGSCNSKKAYINLNVNLLQKPLKAIEYVILHELTHLEHPHHQRSFYERLGGLMSDFRQREALFKEGKR